MKSKPLQVGVTGGIGAGKTTVCKVFGSLGIPVYDADSSAKRLMEESPGLQKKIKTLFGTESYLEQGKLNREYLASLVFSDSKKVQELNNLVHPEVAKDYDKWVWEQGDQFPYVIKEAALLIESGSYQQLDYLVSVVAPVALRIKRVLARDPQRDRQQIESIISKQLLDRERIQKSDKVLYNDEQQSLLQQVLDLHRLLIQ